MEGSSENYICYNTDVSREFNQISCPFLLLRPISEVAKTRLGKKSRVFVLPFPENFANNTMQPIKRILNAACFFCVSIYIWVFPCLAEIFVKLKSIQIYVGMCKSVRVSSLRYNLFTIFRVQAVFNLDN